MMGAALTTHMYETAGVVVQMTRPAEPVRNQRIKPFEDGLDHLKALELESTLMLAITYLRRNGESTKGDEYEPSFPEICRNRSLVEIQELYTATTTENRRREELSLASGVTLPFIAICDDWHLDRFERTVLMLLLMMNAAPDFVSTFNDCDLGKGKNGLEIGTILAITCDNLRDQLASRRYFSVEASLIRNDLITVIGDMDDTSNILEEKVTIQERLVRHMLGDNNLYSTCFRFIKREKCNVHLDQVILPDNDKAELVTCMARYFEDRDKAVMTEVNDFYGYGTSLTYLFHGPSGTGKTMMAKALATSFDRTIFSLSADDMQEMPGSYQDIISTLFREANLQKGIVFFDECDDVFQKGSRASRALLIEIEKARCVVILATNRPVDLDPALERRISMKTYFSIPAQEVRRQIWQALIPPMVTLADDVDLDVFAERYRFTGGLIRNAIFLALTATGSSEGVPTVIHADQLHFAAGKQSATLADERNICKINRPTECLEQMPLEKDQRKRLQNLALVWDSLKKRKMGLSMVITASNVSSAVRAARGVARECNLMVRSFDFQQITTRNPDDLTTDPVTQRMIYPIDYAFAPTAGDEAMVLFIDRDNVLANMLSMKKDKMGDILMSELLVRLRKHTGLFCIVGTDSGEHALPSELHIHERLKVPDREQQENHWRSVIDVKPQEEHDLAHIVASYQLHPADIDFIVRQASIVATIRRLDERPTMADVREQLEKAYANINVPLLFGESLI